MARSRPRQGATAGCHAVLIRRETVRFSEACDFSENWLGWQGSNLRMSVPKTDALPLGYTPAGARPYSVSCAEGKGWDVEMMRVPDPRLDIGQTSSPRLLGGEDICALRRRRLPRPTYSCRRNRWTNAVRSAVRCLHPRSCSRYAHGARLASRRSALPTARHGCTHGSRGICALRRKCRQ